MHENPIAVRSKSRLAESLGALLQEKRFDEITITELCARAKLSRPAFYQNFNSIRDVAVRYFRTALDEAIDKLEVIGAPDARTFARSCISLFESVDEPVELLMKNDLADIVVMQCTETFLEISHRSDYQLVFASAGMANALARERGNVDRDELVDVLERLIG